ncbi:MAG TPA: TonB-dependent receptor [Hyphomonadaceae bacterium]|nr:TonB-dependent receptor [Hyphomonadaceae bacterium]
MKSGYLAARLRRSAAVGVVIAASCSPALAQNSPQQKPEPTPPAAVDTVKPPEQPQDSGDKVVITGSRIARDAFTSTAPIQVITAESSTLEGLVDTAEILQGSSLAEGSTQINNTFGNFVVEGGLGINSVSLRGLGAQRTLVLLNGQRPGPAGTRGQVGAFDLNVVPDSIISRIEILKDGASSVYGSDAVAGVVNVITRSSVDKPELNIQYNATEQGGGNTLEVNGAFGFEFLGGTFMFAGEYEDRDPLKWGDRKNLACAQDLVYDRVTGKRIDRVDHSILQNTSLGNCSTGNIYFNTVVDAFSGIRYVPSPDGVTSGPIPGYRPRVSVNYSQGPVAYYEDVLNSPKFLEGYAIAATERTSLYGRADFDIFGDVKWTTEVLATRRDTDQKAWRQFFPQIASAIGYDVPGPYTAGPGFAGQVIPGVGTLRLTQPVTIWPANQSARIDYYYVNSGLKGDFFLPGWTWSLNASYSRSDGTYTGNEITKDKAGDWRYTSNDGLYHGPEYNPFDPAFLSGNWSQATYDLLTANPVGKTIYDQAIGQGVISGDLLELPAGPLGVAVGVEYRHFKINDTPDPREVADEFWNTSAAGVTRGKDTVTEEFAELNVPLLKGLPFVEELTLDGSGRWFNYDSYGSNNVWKAGLNWQVLPSVRLRGTTGTSYRAPALYELYLGNLTGFQDQTNIDPCIDWGNSSNQNIRTNCAAEGIPSNYTGLLGESAVITQTGGAGRLKAEDSTAKTLGVIWTPNFLDLSVAIDYFDIEVKNQVAQLGPVAILGGCYGAPIFPNAFCSLFHRNPGTDPTAPFNIATVNDSYLNVNSQSTRGIDYTIRYEHEFDFGNLSVDLSATQTLEDVANLFDPNLSSGFATNDFNGSIGDPKWVGNADVQLRTGDFTYSWFIDYIGPTDNKIIGADEFINYFINPSTNLNGHVITTTDPWLSHDVSVRWKGDHYTITGGVLNIFDAQPPVISDGSGQRLQNYALAATQYDLRGRTYFVRLGYNF